MVMPCWEQSREKWDTEDVVCDALSCFANHLDKDCEEDDRDSSRDEEGLSWNARRIDEEDQSESDGATQPAIGHDELFYSAKLM